MTPVEGIWQVEMHGPSGCERVSSAFLEDRRYRAAGTEYDTVGKYEVEGDDLTVAALIVQLREPRSWFGARERTLSISFRGKTDGETVEGQGTDENGAFGIAVQATKVAAFPS